MRKAILLLIAVLLVVTLPPTASAASSVPDSLTITVRWGPGQSDQWTLTCDPTGGSHPNARRACAQLAGIQDPFAVTVNNLMCTQIYSGPERAHVTGTWAGKPVDRRFSRTDGCETARWNEYRALFTDPGAVTVHGSVDLGPTCPVQQVGQDCTLHGAPAIVTARTKGSRLQTRSGASGFSLHLPRGVWTLTADAGMRCTPVRLDLRGKRRAPDVVITCDTGIR